MSVAHGQKPERAGGATATLPTDKELVLKVIPMPSDTNANGDIFGGWVMAQVDMAGSVVPARIAKGRIAPAQKLPGKTGVLLFDRSEVERVATEYAASLAPAETQETQG